MTCGGSGDFGFLCRVFGENRGRTCDVTVVVGCGVAVVSETMAVASAKVDCSASGKSTNISAVSVVDGVSDAVTG